MSVEYDNYIREHKENLMKGLEWMQQNLPESLIDHEAMVLALSNAEGHDQSKYSKEEYPAYDAYFYSGNKTAKVVEEFNYAWLHHIHHNPHHWQYWVLLEDDPAIGSFGKCLEMPMEYIYEMIADWWTFSWRAGNLMDIFNWYETHKDTMKLGVKTKFVVVGILSNMKTILENQMMLDAFHGKDEAEA